jgi:hypothetical protein
MSKTMKVALALALALSTASAATAATKHPVRGHEARIERQIPATALQSFGSAQFPGAVRLAPNFYGDPYNHQERKCYGGACGADWGIYSGSD